MKFHKKVPSFSFSTFSFNQNNNTNPPIDQNNNNQININNEPAPIESISTFISQPNSPARAHFQLHPTPNPPLSAAAIPSNPHSSLLHQQQQHQYQIDPHIPPNRNNSITLLLSPEDPLQFIISQKPHPFRKRSGSLIEQSTRINHQLHAPSEQRRSSLAETFNHLVAPDPARRLSSGNIQTSHSNPPLSPTQPIAPCSSATAPPTPSGTSHFTRHRKRLSNLFSPLTSYHSSASRSPSPGNSHGRHRTVSHHALDPLESDWETNFDPHPSHPTIDLLPSSDSDDDSDSNSNLSQSDRSDQPDPSDSEDETILANTHANASSITPIDFLQKSNQPIPFIDQAPNLTSPPPLPISFVPSDPSRFPTATTKSTPIISPTRKSSLTSRSSIRRRTSSIGARQDLKLTVSRPIYQKNRCTITIQHGDWIRAAEKAERTRFYLVAADLSDESKYAIEWTIGTVLRQGDECLIIMIIETDSKFDPEDGAGSAADRTAKIRNQKDRQEKATLLVREATSLLERTGLNAKVTCQAVHGKNPKHMLVDCIDFLEPNLVIVGRRGMTSAKGSLMGSVSHYLVQKSSVPVMVARRRLRTLPKVYKKKHGLVSNSMQTKLTDASIEKSTTPNKADDTLSAPISNNNENKRLSVVSEEIDLKLQLTQVEFERNQKEMNPDLEVAQKEDDDVENNQDCPKAQEGEDQQETELDNREIENISKEDAENINQVENIAQAVMGLSLDQTHD